MLFRTKAAVGALMVATLGSLAGAAPPVKPPVNRVQRAKASLEPLLQQGADALAAGQYPAARAAFQDAIVIDPRNAKAHHGLALCLVAHKEVAKAAATLDKALMLTGTPDRALVLNAMACQMAVQNHMRAAKLAKDYLTAHPKEQDEPMVNALGTALSAATASERKNRFFGDCTAFYMIANQRLEKARPGYKRFGAEWLSASQADAKTRALAAQQKKLDSLSDAIATSEERLGPAKKELEHQQFLLTRGEAPGNYYLTQAQSVYDAAQAAVQAAQDRYDALASTLETPKFPNEIAMVSMDNIKTPELTPVAVASAAPPPTVEIRPKPRPRPVKPKPAANTSSGNSGEKPVEKPVEITLAPPKPETPRKVRVTQYAAAFPVAPNLVLTSSAIIEDGVTLQLQSGDGQPISATLVRKDDTLGLALLKVEGRTLRPLALADAFNGGPVTCASYPAVDLFSPAAQAITGSATAPKDGWTISLNMHPRLAGAPVLAGGKVVGVCVAPRDAERNKLPAVTLDQLKTFLGSDVGPVQAAGDPASSLLQLVTTLETGG
jgi:tetratricopeptide (TPR) repeat protein